MTRAHNRTPYHQFHDQSPVMDEINGVKFRAGWQCKKCGIAWKKKQYGEDCLGMPRYNVRKYRPNHLFTRKELKRKGLQPGSEPEGYVYVLNQPYWVFLYDIGKATALGKKLKAEEFHGGVCAICERWVTFLSSVGICEGCVLQAQIDAMEENR